MRPFGWVLVTLVLGFLLLSCVLPVVVTTAYSTTPVRWFTVAG